MHAFLGEYIGTLLLILLGNGVVANVVLDKTKGNNSGLIAITFGWAIAVFVGVFSAVKLGSDGHINPAVTLAMVYKGDMSWSLASIYIPAQMAGAFTGAVLVWILYYQHYQQTQDGDSKLATFCTSPAIRHPFFNFISEMMGTGVLVMGVLLMTKPGTSLGTLDALPVALLVLGIGLSLGGPTGYAINPARDLAPRIAHFLLPIPNKRNSDWSYSWVPVLGPVAGGLLAVLIYQSF